MAKDTRTVSDLSDEEYDDYVNNPDDYPDVTDNTHEDMDRMMFPDGHDDDY